LETFGKYTYTIYFFNKERKENGGAFEELECVCGVWRVLVEGEKGERKKVNYAVSKPFHQHSQAFRIFLRFSTEP
jgi:hypothetical protein